MEDIRQFRTAIRLEEAINGAPPKAIKRAVLRAYNQTCQRFISDDVELVEASEGDFEDCYSSLLPGSGSAIWIVPVRELSSTSFCIPVDLLYLDETNAVLETVGLFPSARVSSSIERAASILALPANAILRMGIKAGDQLMLCDPEEIQRYLLSASPPPPEAGSNLPSDDGASQFLGLEQQIGDVREHVGASATSPVPEAQAPPLEVNTNLPSDDEASLFLGFLGLERRLWDARGENARGQMDAPATKPVPEVPVPSLEAGSNLPADGGATQFLGAKEQLVEVREQIGAAATGPIPEVPVPSLEAVSNLSADGGATQFLGAKEQLVDVREQIGAAATGPIPEAPVPSLEAVSNLSADGGASQLLGRAQHIGEIREQGQMESLATGRAPELAPVEVGKPAPVTTPPPPGNCQPTKVSWWRRVLLNEPDDRRWGERKTLPGLVAYFFTGGAPTPNPVHDISSSGLYVLTSERWYQGTYVRLTLTDEREPRAEKTITLHGKVVRSTDSGVAFEFLMLERTRDFAFAFEGPAGRSAAELREFISRF